MALLKVKPWGEGQGEYVLIEEEDFNEEVHTLHESEAEQPKRQRRRRNAEGESDAQI